MGLALASSAKKFGCGRALLTYKIPFSDSSDLVVFGLFIMAFFSTFGHIAKSIFCSKSSGHKSYMKIPIRNKTIYVSKRDWLLFVNWPWQIPLSQTLSYVTLTLLQKIRNHLAKFACVLE